MVGKAFFVKRSGAGVPKCPAALPPRSRRRRSGLPEPLSGVLFGFRGLGLRNSGLRGGVGLRLRLAHLQRLGVGVDRDFDVPVPVLQVEAQRPVVGVDDALDVVALVEQPSHGGRIAPMQAAMLASHTRKKPSTGLPPGLREAMRHIST